MNLGDARLVINRKLRELFTSHVSRFTRQNQSLASTFFR
jgi:hypothetical protein